jgi:hypothetical protein
MFPIETDIYAACPTRLWWAPWRWKLHVHRWKRNPFTISAAETIATNLSWAEVIGLIKLLGYPHEISN